MTDSVSEQTQSYEMSLGKTCQPSGEERLAQFVYRCHLDKYRPGQQHIRSFNAFLSHGIQLPITQMTPIRIKISLADAPEWHSIEFRPKRFIISPTPSIAVRDCVNVNLTPAKCHELGMTYQTKVDLEYEEVMLQPHSVSAKDFAGSSREPRKSDLNAKPTIKRLHVCDGLPVMVLSDACYLSKLTPEERVKHGECAHESGGYFLMAQGKTGTVAERFLEMQDYRAANVISIHAANEKKTKVAF